MAWVGTKVAAFCYVSSEKNDFNMSKTHTLVGPSTRPSKQDLLQYDNCEISVLTLLEDFPREML